MIQINKYLAALPSRGPLRLIKRKKVLKVLKGFSCADCTTLAFKEENSYLTSWHFGRNEYHWRSDTNSKVLKFTKSKRIKELFSSLQWLTETLKNTDAEEMRLTITVFWGRKFQQKCNREKHLGTKAWTNSAHMLHWCWDLSLDHCTPH